VIDGTCGKIIYVLSTGARWRQLPDKELGHSSPITCWPRLRDWQHANVWEANAPPPAGLAWSMTASSTGPAVSAAPAPGSPVQVPLKGGQQAVTITKTFPLLGYSRPGSVTLAAVLQLLLAATFLIMPTVAYLYGARAQAAAEAEVVRQGFPAEILARNHVNFGEGAAGLVLAVAIALALVALAGLNLAGNAAGRIGSWILQPLLLVAGGLVESRQVFAARFLASAFKSSGDATLAGINVKAFVAAATDAYPAWFPYVVNARFVLTTLGSLLIIILLAVPSANAYFR